MLNPDMGSIVSSYASSMSFNFIPYIVSRFYEETGADGIEFTFEQRTTPETVCLFPLTHSLASRSSINLKQQSVFAIL